MVYFHYSLVHFFLGILELSSHEGVNSLLQVKATSGRLYKASVTVWVSPRAVPKQKW